MAMSEKYMAYPITQCEVLRKNIADAESDDHIAAVMEDYIMTLQV